MERSKQECETTLSTTYLIAVAIIAIASLLLLVMKFKWPAFVALIAVSIATGLAAGIPTEEVIGTAVAGMGGTLGSVAILVGLGAMLGGAIEKSGGAEVITEAFSRKFGRERIGVALLVASAFVAIPIFFDVGFIILVPIIFSFAKAAGYHSPAIIGMPVAVLMVFIHNCVPPHPGIVGTTALLHGSLGMVTIVGLILSIPVGFAVHFLFKRINKQEFAMTPEVELRYQETLEADPEHPRATLTLEDGTVVRRPSAGLVIFSILLPIAMITCGTIGALIFDKGSIGYKTTQFLGSSQFALLFSTILAFYLLGVARGFSTATISKLMDDAVGPAAIVILVTGAGGVFAKVLTESGVGKAVSDLLLSTGLPIFFLAFLIATVFKVAQGSGTVASLAAAGLVQDAVLQGGYSQIQVALILAAIGMGSVALSHINDSGFWIATKFMGLSVRDGLRTWSVGATVGGWLGMIIISILWLIV
ncbi:gluconate:H+ symporter [Trueperella sp. LYQ143]|uniref:GntT/GntP/DsdX family permease n=1 Tax=Trueperella sp. LYQ143 TaxID=3391059 RepID=UPI003982DD96